MKTHQMLLFITFFALLNACNKDKKEPVCCSGPGIRIYKTKQDYRQNIFVGMDKAKQDIISSLGTTSLTKIQPIELADGFLLATGRSGPVCFQCVPTSILLFDSINIDTIGIHWINYVIDEDPFSYFYESKDRSWQARYTSTGLDFCYPDTSELNRIIRSGEIEQYFDRKK